MFAGGVGEGEAVFHGPGIDDRGILAVVFQNSDFAFFDQDKMRRVGKPGDARGDLEVTVFFQIVDVSFSPDQRSGLGLSGGARERFDKIVGDCGRSGGGVKELVFFG